MNLAPSPDALPAPPRSRSTRYRTLAIFAGGEVIIFGLLLLVGLILADNFRSNARFQMQVNDSFELRSQIQRLLSILQDTETGERGYVITGKPVFLDPYFDAARLLDNQLEHVRALLSGDAENKETMARLSGLINVEVSLMKRVVGAVQSARGAEAAAIVSSGEGKRDMDAVRVAVAELLDRESGRLRDRLAAEPAISEHLQIFSFSLLLAIAVLSVFSPVFFLKFQNHQQVLREARQRLDDQAAELEEVERAEARYRGLLEAAPDAMVVVNVDGEIVLLNAQAEKQFGYRRDELAGQNVKRIIPEGFEERLIADDLRSAAAARAQEIGGGIELTGRRKDGSEFPIEIMLSPSVSAEGVVVTAAIRNITARKEAEAHLRHISEIERMQREFVSTVSHELRTPLTSIGGSLALIASGSAGVTNHRVGRLIEIAHNNTQRLIRLVNDILDIEKLKSGRMAFQFAPVRIDEIIEQAITGTLSYAESFGIKLLRVGGGADAVVSADAGRLDQALTNLISNAVKFSQSGANVEISTTPSERGVRITVADQGPGIPEEFRARIFERFAQADSSDARQKAGSGLGLSIVREILQRHGGSVSFDSKTGKGANFHLDLPLVAGSPQEMLGARAKRANFVSPAQNQTRSAWAAHDERASDKGEILPDAFQLEKLAILHIEDDRELNELVRQALQDEFRVVSAVTLDEARRYLIAENFDLFILDLTLADGLGEELLPLLVDSAGRPIPTVIFTAQDSILELAGRVEAVLTKSRTSLATLVETVRLAITATRRGVEESRNGALRVLYIDDEADIRELATLALELDPNIEIRNESSGAAGITTAASWRPDAILLDVMMPLMDGRTTLRNLRSNPDTRDLPVIFITARAQSKDVEELIRLGARAVITKPFNPMTLAAELRVKLAA